MGLLIHPSAFSVSLPPKPPSSSRKSKLRFSASAVDLRGDCNAAEYAGTAIVWYKHDLRMDDHPGLVAASKYRCVVPLYIFDRRILSRFSDEMLELLLFALEDLRKLLKEQGSNLLIRFGNAESVIGELVKEVQATSIFVEEEVEYELRVMIDIVKESLAAASFTGGNPKIVSWSTPFYGIKDLTDLPTSFDDFKRLKLPVVSRLAPPKLCSHLMNFSWGTLPALTDMGKFLDNVPDCGNTKDKWNSVRKFSLGTMLQRKKLKENVEMNPEEMKEENQCDSSINTARRKKLKKSAFITRKGISVGGGSSLVLDALAAYLRYQEGAARDEWQEVHEKLRLAEKREGASFRTLFGSALLLGIISRKRVYLEATKYEKERNGGFMSPFGYSTSTVASSIDTVRSMEWYWLLNLKVQRENAVSIRVWRWNTHLIQYTVAGHEGPPVLLVHGFGAFLEHYRDNILPISEGGNRVWAITLLGFGKSEKPNIMYTEVVWAELLRDFIIDVVGEPVHLVGNSIGGYCVAIVAGLWSSLVKSVVLMNTAGSINPGYSPLAYSEDRRTSALAGLGARLLLLYLRFNIRNILRGFYPTNAERADDWLTSEMVRASFDPGVVFIMESIFSFDLSLPLNYLLEGFEKKLLVIQGMKDPLYDSKSMLAMFREHFSGVVIKELDAGHCPHDELPDEVNSIIKEWVVTLEGEWAAPVEGEVSPVALKQSR